MHQTEIGVVPIKNNVIIEPQTEGDLYQGTSILIPDAFKLKWQRGRVVAIGPGKTEEGGRFIPVEVKVGDVVGYTGNWQGEEFELAGKTYRALEADQIAFVVE